MKLSTRLTSISMLAVTLLLSSASFSQNEKGFTLIDQTDQSLLVSFDNPSFTQGGVDVNGQQMSIINTDQGADMLIAGVPDLPHYSQSVIIPNQGQTTLNITFSDYYDIPNVEIAPSKGNLYRNVDPSTVPFEFGPVYNQDAFYPGTLAELSDPFILRSYRGQTITTYPFQYNPVTKVLRVYEDLNVSVVTDESETGINELETVGTMTNEFRTIAKHQFLNYSANQSKYTVVDEKGSMLVIGPATFSAQMEELIEWKNQKGIRCEYVDIASIGNVDTDILGYIEDYYANDPDLQFVLLVGDHAEVNSHTYGSTGMEELWSDSYYGQMTNDFYPEIFVGRFSASTTEEIQVMIDRTIEYEKDPLAGSHYTKAIGLGSDEGAGIGDDGEADWQHLRNIRDELLAFGYTEVYEFYDGSHGGADASGNPSTSSIETAVNNGITLFNYTGHGAQNVCVSGNYGTPEINSASNNGKYPFVVSVACNNGTFTSGTCISEAWLTASNTSGPLGAIAATGSTILMSWAPPMETQDEMAMILTEQYTNNKKTTLGGLFFNSCMSTVEDYGAGGEEVMQTWTFFGDPSAVIRTLDPLDLTATHVSTTNVGATGITVNCNVEGADVAVTIDNEIIGTAVVSGGSAQVTFDNPLSTQDPLLVTATKYNYRPYQGDVIVDEEIIDVTGIEENETSLFSMYPNPAEDFVNITFNTPSESNVVLTLTDLSGKIIYVHSNGQSSGLQSLEVPTHALESGIYLVSLNVNGSTSVEKLTVVK